MSDPFIGEIKIFAGNFAPYGWAFCNGQIMQVYQNTALFALIGNYYGGDGKTTFALPDFQGLAPMHQGAGPGLTPRRLAENGGNQNITLGQQQMPYHSHPLQCSSGNGASTNPQATVPAAIQGQRGQLGAPAYVQSPVNLVPMNDSTLSPAGENQPHNNMQPFLALNFIIALQGIFPPRS